MSLYRKAKYLYGLAKNTLYYFGGRKENRQEHAYCMGPPRTGTHSMAYMVGGALRSAHEPDSLTTTQFSISYGRKLFGDTAADIFIEGRDKRLNLEFESSHYMHVFSHILAEKYPKSKYIVTVRKPYSWIESEMNQNVASNDNYWNEYQNFIYGSKKRIYKTQEHQVLLFEIGKYLDYWSKHYEIVLNNIPKNRSLYLRTKNISKRVKSISDFLGVHPKKMNTSRSHSGKRKKNTIKLNQITSSSQINKMIHKKCSSVIRKLNQRLDSKIRITD